MSRVAVVIPARHGSTRLPGKPLLDVAGTTLLGRVVEIAQRVTIPDGVMVVVATDHEGIAEHARNLGAIAIMTSPDAPSGTDRALQAVHNGELDAEVIVNLQGDAPFTPPAFVEAVISAFEDAEIDVATPVHRLSWPELVQLRAAKREAPFSGTCAIVAENGDAIWFSKQVIPAIRNETARRDAGEVCPVLKHVGLYAYRREVLERIVIQPPSHYERLEGLEQLRFLEMGLKVRTVPVAFDSELVGFGVDAPEDLRRAEALLAACGEPDWRMPSHES